ncbi:unnamed protein product [Closterium sp. Yama58-4]|nr:unnamed protein product [Closterium sp. Yama58-4]
MNFDAIIAGMYALSTSVEGDCYLCAPYDPGIEAAALGASESALSGTAPAEALHTFTLDSSCGDLYVLSDWPSPGHVYSSAGVECVHTDYCAASGRCVRSGVPISKGEVPTVLIPWIRAVRLQLRERFHTDLPVLRLHSDRGSEFSSDLLRSFCEEEGIHQSFTLPASLQQNGIAERHIGLVMEVARTSIIYSATPHFLWPFAVRYVAHQLNLWLRVSLPETSPTLRWTGKVGDASAFRVWGSCAFVCNSTAGKLSSRAIPCIFLGFPPDAPGWQFYHPTSRRVFPSQDVTFDESVPFYRLFFYRTASLPPPAALPCSRSPSVVHVEVTGDSGAAGGGAARGAEPGGAESGGAASGGAKLGGSELGGAEHGGAELGGTELRGVAFGGAEPRGAEPGGAEPGGTEPGGAEPGGAAPRGSEPGGVGSTGSLPSASP